MQSKKAFTLVEIGVVLAIVALLAALLLPAFARQRQNAYQTTCQSNLGQIYKAFQMYVQDHDNRFPNLYRWSPDVEPYIKHIPSCPAIGPASEHETSYNFNVMRFNILSHDKKGQPSWAGAWEGSFPSVSNMVMLEDGRSWGDTEDVVFPQSCGLRDMGELSGVMLPFAIYHRGGGNYLFGDGHVKWLLPQAAADAHCLGGNWRPR